MDQDEPQRYAKKGKVFYNDGRELELLQHVFSRPEDQLAKMRGNPKAILACIDEFARKKFLMTIGPFKAQLLLAVLEEHKPKSGIECGVYIGYSAILFGHAIRKYGGEMARYWCFEKNSLFASVATKLVEFAGLAKHVKIVIGHAGQSMQHLKRTKELVTADFVFLDHLKPRYISDLQVAERLEIIHSNTMIVADDAFLPATEPYLKYVRMDVRSKIALYEDARNASELREFNKLITKELLSQPECIQNGPYMEKGNPRLCYRSQLKVTVQPHGAPVRKQEALETQEHIKVADELRRMEWK